MATVLRETVFIVCGLAWSGDFAIQNDSHIYIQRNMSHLAVRESYGSGKKRSQFEQKYAKNIFAVGIDGNVQTYLIWCEGDATIRGF